MLGALAGVAALLVALGLLESMLFDVAPRDPATYVGVTAFLLLVALGASSLPAWRALQVDPVEALKGE